MSNQNVETLTEPVLIIVGGAINYVEDEPRKIPDTNQIAKIALMGVRLLEQSYSMANRGVYRSLGTLSARSELVIPEFLGVLQLEQTYEHVEEEILSRMANYPDATRFNMIGFSMGGPFVCRFETEHPDQIERGISIAGAHKGSILPLFGPRHFKPFLEKTADLRTDQGADIPPVSFLGSAHDRLIPIDSALPEMPYVDRRIHHHKVGGFTTNHLSIAWHKDTLETCQKVLESTAA